MRAMCKMRYLVSLISLTFDVCSQENIGDPGPEYDCSYCQPEQIHMSFGGKLHSFPYFAQKAMESVNVCRFI